MSTVEQPTLPGIGLLPDLPGYVHGIKSVDPPRIQCDGCGKVDEGQKLGLTILLSDIRFRPRWIRADDNRRMCEPCWEEEPQ